MHHDLSAFRCTQYEELTQRRKKQQFLTFSYDNKTTELLTSRNFWEFPWVSEIAFFIPCANSSKYVQLWRAQWKVDRKSSWTSFSACKVTAWFLLAGNYKTKVLFHGSEFAGRSSASNHVHSIEFMKVDKNLRNRETLLIPFFIDVKLVSERKNNVFKRAIKNTT
jgi:hypothetical protein